MMTDEQIVKILRKHFTEVVAEGRESTDLYVGKSETFISFARSIIDSLDIPTPEVCEPCNMFSPE